MEDIQEGQTATNPKTGQKIVFRAGQWHNASSVAVGSPLGPVPVTRGEAIARIRFRANAGTPLLRADMDPYRGMTDPKQRAMAMTQGLSGARKETAQGRTGVAKVRADANYAAQIMDLQKKMATGGMSGRLLSSGLVSSLFGNANTERMNQLGLNIARNSRVPGEGSISDYDARQFQQMAPGMDKFKGTNEMWARAAMAQAKAMEQHEDFKSAFVAANKTIEGADAIWNEYKDSAGRIFNDDGSFNDKRQNWRDWIKTKSRQYLQAAQGGGQPARMKYNPATGEIE